MNDRLLFPITHKNNHQRERKQASDVTKSIDIHKIRKSYTMRDLNESSMNPVKKRNILEREKERERVEIIHLPRNFKFSSKIHSNSIYNKFSNFQKF